MTKLKFVNVFFLQWVFIRLTKCTETKIESFEVLSFELMPNGSLSSRGHGTQQKYEWYSLQYCIVPLTGWFGTKFKFLTKVPKFKRLTEKSKVVEIETIN